jgi:hypothetical protein
MCASRSHRTGRVRTNLESQVLSLTMTLKGLPVGLFRCINRTALARGQEGTISQRVWWPVGVLLHSSHAVMLVCAVA